MRRNLLLPLLLPILLALPATAQSDYLAKTAEDPSVAIEVLDLQLRPLVKEQVEAEAKAWQAVLAAKNGEMSTKQIAAKSATGDAKSTLDNEISALREQQVQIVDRLTTVLKALTERGGETEPFEQYVNASTRVTIDATDVSGTVTFLKNWVTSPEGGIRVGLNILKFLLTLLAFRILANVLAGIVSKALHRMRRTSDLLRDFFINTMRKVTFFIGIVVALSMLEIDVGPFVAAIGAAGFVIAFALQGTLSNFAAGIMILVYRPYDIGQVVTVAGTTGKVDEMTLVSTTLRLFDNQTVIVPNNSIWGDVITNVTGQTTRRVDMKFGCGYGDDLKKVQALLEEIVRKHPKTHDEPAPVVKLHELGDSSVNFIVRPWTNTTDYWEVFWDVTREVKQRFDEEGLSIPFPQRDVHVHQVGA